jgi:hypothetical protein
MADAMDREIPFIILENPVWGKENGVYTWAYNGLNGGGWVPSAPAEVRSSPELLPWRDWQDGETQYRQSFLGHSLGNIPSCLTSVSPFNLFGSASQTQALQSPLQAQLGHRQSLLASQQLQQMQALSHGQFPRTP